MTLTIPAVAATGDVTLTLPAGIVDGSKAWAFACYNPQGSGLATPSGWTLDETLVVSSSMHMLRYSRLLGSAQSGTTVLFDNVSATGKMSALGFIEGPDVDHASVNITSGFNASAALTFAAITQTGQPGTRRALAVACTRGSASTSSITRDGGFSAVTSAFNTGSGLTGIVLHANATDDADGTLGAGTYTLNTAQVLAQMLVTYELASAVVTVDLAPATLTAAAQPLTPVPGPVTVNLQPATMTLAVQAVPPAGGAVVVNLAPAVLTATPRPLAPAPGPVTLTLGPATVTVQPRPFTIPTVISQLQYPVYIAHRGGANLSGRNENTTAAYAASIANDHPAMLLEADVALLGSGGTAEERLCLTHEGDDLSTNGRTVEADGVTIVTGTALSKSVTQWDSYQIIPRTGIGGGNRPASRWWTGIPGNPGLGELLLANPTRGGMPEVKEPGALTPLIDSIKARALVGQTIVQSFDWTEAQAIAAAGLNTCYLLSAFTSPTAAAVYAAGIRWVGIDRTNVNLAALCTAAHAAGLKVFAYTVNSTANQATALAAGVDGMFTDRPDIVNAGGYVALTPAQVTAQPQPITATPGPVTLALTRAQLTLQPQPLTPVAPVTVTLQPALVTVQAQPLTATPGPVAMGLQPAALTVQARPVAPAPGVVAVGLQPATLTVQARPVTATPGPVTTTLAPASMLLQPIPMAGVAPSTATLAAAQLTLQPQQLGPQPGPVTVTLQAAVLTMSARPMVPAPEPVQLALVAATVTVQPRPWTVTPGPVLVDLQPALLVLSVGRMLADLLSEQPPARYAAVGARPAGAMAYGAPGARYAARGLN